MQNNDVARPEAGTDGLVPIYHPSGLDSRVLPKAVRGWERQGWSTTKPTDGTDESPDAPATEGAEGATTTVTEPTAPPAPSAGRAKSEAAPAAKSK